jgi:hypothetical protein
VAGSEASTHLFDALPHKPQRSRSSRGPAMR